MTNPGSSRREFLCDTMLAAGAAVVLPGVTGTAAKAERSSGAGGKLHVACNQYSWSVFYQREGKDFNQLLDAGLADVKASGLDGFEPGVGGLEQIDAIVPLLVLEQAIETGSPNTTKPVEAFRKSTAYAREVFAGLRS